MRIEEFDILNITIKCDENKFCILHELFRLEQINYIRLYAGTYSLANAMDRIDIEQATFYFYNIKSKEGFMFNISRMGLGIYKDDNIFKFSHRYLYNKNHLSNRFFGESDQRSGEFFRKKSN